ncbi:c-type cytochrome biogenesis protein CcsB [Thermodesulfobacteriota bacterium]
MDINIYFFKATAVFYFFSVAIFFFYLITQKDEVTKIAVGMYFVGFIVHTLGMIVRYTEAGYAPMVNLHEGLSFLSWCISIVFFSFNLRFKIRVFGVFAAPLSLAFILISFAFSSTILSLAPVLQSYWRPIHIFCAIVGDAMFGIAALAGIMYLLQERQLKTKKMTKLYHILPSLEVSDSINYKCLTFGFPMLTLGMVTGAIWANSAWGTYWSWDPKETWSLITWFIYAAMLHGRLTVGWRGRKVAILSIVGFLVILFTFLGVNLLIGGSHAEDSHITGSM